MSRYLSLLPLAVVVLLLIAGCGTESTAVTPYTGVHRNITSTIFWVGEDASEDNSYIPNAASAWDDHWMDHYGGVDDPVHRTGYLPAGFTPKENPFYFALPYDDFADGVRKTSASRLIPWAKGRTWGPNESMCKNQWIKITNGNTVAYAQWEDVGPFEENDAAYVFGTARPRNKINNNAGLDVSPAVAQYLSLEDIDSVDWQFVSAADVPDGPWKQVVTTSQIDWE